MKKNGNAGTNPDNVRLIKILPTSFFNLVTPNRPIIIIMDAINKIKYIIKYSKSIPPLLEVKPIAAATNDIKIVSNIPLTIVNKTDFKLNHV